MNILIFISGFVLGVFCVIVPFKFIEKNSQMTFENLANKILKDNSEELTTKNKEHLGEFLKDFKEQISDFEKRTNENFKQENEKLTRFDTNIENFLKAGNQIAMSTNSLVNVMKSDNRKSGRWGEIVLEKVLEHSGLRKGEEYDVQSGTSEGRPDAVVYLPDDKCIYIDSKTSFASWDGYVNSEETEEKEYYLKQFIDSTKKHIKGLSDRDYSQDEKCPKYVLMFIPIESCYALMFCDDNALWDFAWSKGIMPVSPSTLLAALKIINSFLISSRQEQNAREIAKICSRMIDKFSDILKELNKFKDIYNSVITKLSGKDNIINQLTRIEELGIKGTKELPEIPVKLTDNE